MFAKLAVAVPVPAAAPAPGVAAWGVQSSNHSHSHGHLGLGGAKEQRTDMYVPSDKTHVTIIPHYSASLAAVREKRGGAVVETALRGSENSANAAELKRRRVL